MQLLRLPVELLALALAKLDPASFHSATLACRMLRRASSMSRTLLLQQIDALPGSINELCEESTERLFVIFQKRATKNLCGLSTRAGLTRYSAFFNNINIKSSLFTAERKLFIVCHSEPLIRCYELGPSKPTLVAILRPDCPCGEDDAPGSEIEILKIASSHKGENIAALVCTKSPSNPTPMAHVASTVDQLQPRAGTFPQALYKVVIFRGARWKKEAMHISYATCTELETMALGNSLSVAISSRNSERPSTRYVSVFKPKRSRLKHYGCDPDPILVHLQPNNTDPAAKFGVISRMEFAESDKRLVVYDSILSSAPVILHLEPNKDIHEQTFERSLRPLPTGSGDSNLSGGPAHLSTLLSLVHAHHVPEGIYTGPERTCVKEYFALAAGSESGHVCLLYTNMVIDSVYCSHQTSNIEPFLEFGEWLTDIRLEGLKPGQTSIGIVFAVSETKKRVAVATWTDVCIWNIEEEVFQGAGPTFHSRGLEEARPGVHHDAAHLPCNGIVHHMCFHGDCILYTMTDRGLSMWELDCVRPRAVETYELLFD